MTEAKKRHGGARLHAGRPPVPDGPLIKWTAKVTPKQKEKAIKLGGAAWLRKVIDTTPE